MNVDVIGGGISGLSSAISLKENNQKINVIVHEKYKRLGFNFEGRRCGEAYSVNQPWNKWKPNKNCIFNEIRKYEIVFGKKKLLQKLNPHLQYILDRQKFIHNLGKKAKEVGVEILTNDKINSINELNTDYIIDATGCPSNIREELGLKEKSVGLTYQQTMEKSNCFVQDTMKFFWAKERGYYWIFPRNPTNNEINIGIGLKQPKHNLKPLLEKFKKNQNICGQVNHTIGGFVPLGIQKPLRYGNILFVGDSGAGAGILSGAGIPRALISGDIAGKCIAEGCTKEYDKIILNMFSNMDFIENTYSKISDYIRKINPNLYQSINYISYKAVLPLLNIL